MPAPPKLNRPLRLAALLGAGLALAPLAAAAAAPSAAPGLRLPAAAKLHAVSPAAAPPAARPAPHGFHPPAPYDRFYSYYAWYAPLAIGTVA